MTHLTFLLRQIQQPGFPFELVKPLLARWPVALMAVMLGLLSPMARSAPICRWVDKNGQSHMSDAVPDKYKQVATCSDSRQYELSPQQTRDAEQRLTELKARARQNTAAAPIPAVSSATGTGPLPRVKRPTEVITDTTDCQTRWRIYDESVDCFGPYRTTRGATKPEGYDVCNEIPSPELKCGPRRN